MQLSLEMDLYYTNLYYCKECQEAWEERWACSCDSPCPKCTKLYTPFENEQDWITAIKSKSSLTQLSLFKTEEQLTLNFKK